MTHSDTPFSLHYDVPHGKPWWGWRVTFTLTKFPHGSVPSVKASCGRKTIRNVREICAILPGDLWPEFAQPLLSRQRVGNSQNDDERLF